MSKGISLYPTTKTGADTPENVTGTSVPGDKFAMDVRIGAGSGSILAGLDWDDNERTATTATTETWTVRKGGTDIATVLITFEDATKECVIRAQRTDL